jgi:hypothetical protein
MATRAQRVYRFCRGDGSLTIAVGILVAWLFVLAPLREIHEIGGLAVDLAFAAFLAFGAMFVLDPRPVMRLFLIFLAATMFVRIVDTLASGRALDALSSVLTAISAFLLGVLFLGRVMRDGRINVHRIMGAVGAFLLIGVLFSQGYRLIALFFDGAFAIGGAPAASADFVARVNYFSFVTLTSLGYGDITPLHPFARSLVTLEALTGQLFLAILVARLVAMEIEWRHDRRAAGDDRIDRG